MLKKICFKIIVFLTIFCFFFTIPKSGYAQIGKNLPVSFIQQSDCLIRGLKVYPQDPFRFDFLLEADKNIVENDLIKKLIRYFLTALTIPKENLWVNLSPYEKERIVPESFGQTEMGRDLLAQDYVLKQITSSLMNPQEKVGKVFWKRIYQKTEELFGTTDIPIDVFNKVWIVPAKAVVYENAQTKAIYIVESKLKVMSETDYLAQSKNVLPTGGHAPRRGASRSARNISDSQSIAQEILYEVIIPILEKEINEGASFAPIRQIYQTLILAFWYKKRMMDSFISKTYVDQEKTEELNHFQEQGIQKIWERYVSLFKKGAFHFIDEEKDFLTQETLPRKYFSGGANFSLNDEDVQIRDVIKEGLFVDASQEDFRVIQTVLAVTNGERKKYVQRLKQMEEEDELLYQQGGGFDFKRRIVGFKKTFLESKQAPDNIVFEVGLKKKNQPIDDETYFTLRHFDYGASFAVFRYENMVIKITEQLLILEMNFLDLVKEAEFLYQKGFGPRMIEAGLFHTKEVDPLGLYEADETMRGYLVADYVEGKNLLNCFPADDQRKEIEISGRLFLKDEVFEALKDFLRRAIEEGIVLFDFHPLNLRFGKTSLDEEDRWYMIDPELVLQMKHYSKKSVIEKYQDLVKDPILWERFLESIDKQYYERLVDFFDEEMKKEESLISDASEGFRYVPGFSPSLKTKEPFLTWIQRLIKRQKEPEDLEVLRRLDERLNDINMPLISLTSQKWYLKKADNAVAAFSDFNLRHVPIPLREQVSRDSFWEELQEEYASFSSMTQQPALLEIPYLLRNYIQENAYERLLDEAGKAILDHLKLYYIYHSRTIPYSLLFLRPKHVFLKEFEDALGHHIVKVIFLSKSNDLSSLTDINEFFFVDGEYYGYGHMKLATFMKNDTLVNHVKMLFNVLDQQRGRVKGLSKFIFQDREKEAQTFFIDRKGRLLIEKHQIQNIPALFFYTDLGFVPSDMYQKLLEELKRRYQEQQKMKAEGLLIDEQEDIEKNIEKILKVEGALGEKYGGLFRNPLGKEVKGSFFVENIFESVDGNAFNEKEFDKGGVDFQTIERDLFIHADQDGEIFFDVDLPIDQETMSFSGFKINKIEISPVKSVAVFMGMQ